jgi:hypothetical protein
MIHVKDVNVGEPIAHSSITMPSVTAKESKGKLLFCFLGIFISFTIFGILQEAM